MGLGRDYARQDCALASALELIGERWTLLVIRDAFYGVRRYSDFLAHLDAPRAVLAARLQTLVAAGILEKQPTPEAPTRSEYVLTDVGTALWPSVYALVQWGEQYVRTTGARRLFLHAADGAGLTATGACSACGTQVAAADVEIHPGPGARSDRRDDPVSQALRRPHRLLQPLLGPDRVDEPVA